MTSTSPFRYAGTGSAGDTVDRIATSPATPSTVPICRPILRIPLPVPNRPGASPTLPAPSSDGMVSPTPAPPSSWAGSRWLTYAGEAWIRDSHSACARALTRHPITATRPGPPSRTASRGATTRANGSTMSGPGAMASPASTAE